MQHGQPPGEEEGEKRVRHKQDGDGRCAHSFWDRRTLALPLPLVHNQLNVYGGEGEDVDAEERRGDDEQEEEAVVPL